MAKYIYSINQCLKCSCLQTMDFVFVIKVLIRSVGLFYSNVLPLAIAVCCGCNRLSLDSLHIILKHTSSNSFHNRRLFISLNQLKIYKMLSKITLRNLNIMKADSNWITVKCQCFSQIFGKSYIWLILEQSLNRTSSRVKMH